MFFKQFRGLPATAALFGVLLAGCTPLLGNDQPSYLPDHTLVLESGHTLGQTFVAQHSGLNGIKVWLQPSPNAHGMLTLRLREDVNVTTDLAVATLLVKPGMESGFYHFGWEADVHSHGAYRYVRFEYVGQGQVDFGAANGESYLNGAAYVDDKPQDDRQLTFSLTYDWWSAAVGFIGRVQWYARLALLSLLLFVFPGIFFLEKLRIPDLPAPAQVGIAAGISIAVHPLIVLWMSAAGFQIGPIYTWITAGFALLVLIFWCIRRCSNLYTFESVRHYLRSEAFLSNLAFLVIALLVFGVRMMVVSSLPAPLWGDSFHHSMITQLIVDHGGLFDSWMPYARLSTFTYHFGFHAATALLLWATGTEAHEATLWAGQIFNSLAVIAVYPLAWQLTKNRWAGIVAVLVAGLILPMPMYYVNWGRYTQLTGQVILPAAMILSWYLFDTVRSSPARLLDGRLLLTALTFSGLLLTHYRVSAIFICFLLVLLLTQIGLLPWFTGLRIVVLLIGVSIFLTIPWWLRVGAGLLPSWLYRFVSTMPQQRPEFWIGYNASVGSLDFYMPYALWLGWLCAVGLALWSRNRAALVLSGWVIVVLITANPDWFGLPGAGAITNFALAIAVYVVAAPFLGYATVSLLQAAWRGPATTVASLGLTAIVLILLALGATSGLMRSLKIINPANILVTVPDQKAMAWIRDNTPENAVFLVDTFAAYGNEAFVGSDAGWWIPLLARRANTVPPLTYLGEKGLEADFRERVNAFAASWIDGSQPITLVMQEAGVDYVYVGQTHSPNQNLVRRLKAQLPSDLQVVYKRDRVAVYKLSSANRASKPFE